jgi:predicted nuclease of predicted toxin-antitoxin system
MRVLLDECVDWRFIRDLSGFDARTVRQMGWNETKNGALLALAGSEFDVFITIDKNLSFQQNVSSLALAVVVLHPETSRLKDLRKLAPALRKLLPTLKAGEFSILIEHGVAS